MRIALVVASLLASSVVVRSAAAETIQVGPSRSMKTLQAVQGSVNPGDVVELDGDATYPGGVFFRAAQSGTPSKKITIRGVKVNGKRPVISGGGSGSLAGLGLVMNGDSYVFESLELTGSSNVCVIHKANDITMRDVVVHDCPADGLLGNDDEAGSLTLESSEFYNNGSGMLHHQIYMATSEDAFPGSVFRMQNCFVHDGKGGNNVKSRAQRNEIYFNWIEGAYYHGLELIGPDKSPATAPREDSDVVGNVIVGNGAMHWHLVRIGGDKDDADTSGRYRFVNNTFFVAAGGAESVIRAMLHVDTIEMHNNAFVSAASGNTPMFDIGDVQWVNGVTLFGSHNWVQSTFSGTPATWTSGLSGADAGLVDPGGFDLRPTAASPLDKQAVANPPSVPGRAFPSPLATPASAPPARLFTTALAGRGATDGLAIGAYESSAAPPGTPGTPGPEAPPSSPGLSGAPAPSGSPAGAGDGGTGDGGANAASPADDSGCSCSVGPRRTAAAPVIALCGAVAFAMVRRRRRRG